MKRIRHADIVRAVGALNDRRGIKYPDIGYLLYSDIRGDGGPYNPNFYVISNPGGGVSCVNYTYMRDTMRATLANLESMK